MILKNKEVYGTGLKNLKEGMNYALLVLACVGGCGLLLGLAGYSVRQIAGRKRRVNIKAGKQFFPAFRFLRWGNLAF